MLGSPLVGLGDGINGPEAALAHIILTADCASLRFMSLRDALGPQGRFGCDGLDFSKLITRMLCAAALTTKQRPRADSRDKKLVPRAASLSRA
jgi:hypothetical protein